MSASIIQQNTDTKVSGYLLAAFTAGTLAAAWLMPLSVAGAMLALVAVCGLCYLAAYGRLLTLYLTGTAVYLAAFSWLAPTMETFSGLPAAISGFFFALFCLVSAGQFVLFGFFTKTLRRYGFFITAPCFGWLAAQTIFFRLFPWTPGHSLIAIPELAQLAYFAGANGCTALMFLVCGLLIKRRNRALNIMLAVTLCCTWAWFGAQHLKHVDDVGESQPSFPIALVQGNISVKQKHSKALWTANVNAYLALSRAALKTEAGASQPALVVWPETVLLEPVEDNLKEMKSLALGGSTLLFGALSVGAHRTIGEQDFFNTAWTVLSNGQLSAPYHKRILMPFGEFTPGLSWFPALKEINQNAAEFAAGSEQTVMAVPFDEKTVRIAPLICYEDVLPSLAHEAANLKAQVLVNMSNDGWFGESVAAQQHHQIAAFRAIETGLPLLRNTNTGFTAAVDASGRILGHLPEHAPGVLTVKLPFGPGPAAWGANEAELIWKIIAILVAALSIFQLAKK